MTRESYDEYDYEKKNRGTNIYVMSFVVPLIIMVVIFIIRGIFPFGQQSFFNGDLYHQYFPFLKELNSIIKSGGSLMYSWRAGLGTNFLAMFAYYLATPTNLLSLIVPEGFLIEFISYMSLIKMGLAGLTFSHYLRKKFNTNSNAIILFSLGYSMCAYFAAYNWNVMWLDCLIMIPLIILGLDRLVNEGKMSLYIISLGFCIYSNYYLSIMVCMFVVLYYIVLFVGAKHKLRSIWQFACSSLLAGGIATVLILPEIGSMAYSEFTTGTIPTVLKSYFSMFEAFARQLMMVDLELGLDHWPNIYCGVAIIILLFLYMFTGKVSLKERIPKIILTVFMLFSFSYNIPNYIWHGLNYPNSYPARQSFLYIFLILTMGFEAYLHIKETKWIWLILSGVLGGGIIGLAYVFVNDDAFSIWTYLCSGLAMAIFFVLLLIYKKSKSLRKTALYLVSLVFVIIEVTGNMMYTSVGTVSRTNYVNEMDKYSALSDYIKKADTSFYRVEKTTRVTQNDSMLSSYDSATLFSSVSNSLVKEFYARYGLKCSKVFYCADGATPLISSMLGVKYTMGQFETTDDPMYEKQLNCEDAYLYKNKYYLPLGFCIPEQNLKLTPNPKDLLKESQKRNRSGYPVFDDLNELAKKLGATEDLFVKIEVVNSSGSTVIEVPSDGRVYSYTSNGNIKKLTALWGPKTETYSGYTDNYICDLGSHKAGDIITLSTSDITNTLSTTAVIFNEEAFNKLYEQLNSSTLKIAEMNDTYIKGTVSTNESKDLFLSIPYNLNWKVKVDGIETNYSAFDDTFISIPITSGTHTIELIYQDKLFIIGLVISLVSLGIWLTICIYERKKDKM